MFLIFEIDLYMNSDMYTCENNNWIKNTNEILQHKRKTFSVIGFKKYNPNKIIEV